MKKKLIALLSVFTLALSLTACSFGDFDGSVSDNSTNSNSADTNSSENSSSSGTSDSASSNDSSASDSSGDNSEDSSASDSSGDSSEDSSASDSSGDSSNDSSSSSGNEKDEYIYKAFTASEKKLFNDYFGFVIPFAENNEYYIDDYTEEYAGYYDAIVNYYTLGNTQAEFNAYKTLFDKEYTFIEEYEDDYGDICYLYSKGETYIDVCYYEDEGETYIDIYVYMETMGSGSTSTDFTAEEKALFEDYFGFVVPFIESEEYYVEEYEFYYEDTDETEIGVNFYAYGLTSAEFNDYKALFTTANGYTYDGEEEDSYGDMWYYYTKNGHYVDVTYYMDDYGDYLIDVYVYDLYEGDLTGGSGSGSGSTSTDFTAEEKALFEDYFGFVVPFIESEEYYVEEYELYYEETDETEIGVNFYAYGLTSAEFNDYKALFTTANGYTYDGEEEDEYGDMWYYYTKNGHYVDVTYYMDDYGDYLTDVYVYDLYEGDLTGGSGSGSGSEIPEDIDLITNAGMGLPSDTDGDGVYDVDFTKATYVKNVTEQGYYLDGCPTTGSPKVLVIPVEFSDCTAASKGYTIDKIKAAFEQGGKTDYFSVYDYYYQASYGALTLDITVLDEWFMPSKTSSYYKTATIDYYGQAVEVGEQLIMDEVLAYLAGIMDLSQFDSDGNTIIDSIVFVNTLEIDNNNVFNWAFRYWNLYTNEDGYYYEYDGVSANDYVWASYQFLFDSYDEEGYQIYDENVMNTYTFIHEFGHVLGAEDYYDTSYSSEESPTVGADVMDSMLGDHNAYTKFNYGWLTSSRLVVAEESVTLTLEAFYENGDTIIIANNWDDDLGAYQEYYILAYYRGVGLNDEALDAHYFARDGIVVYHVNASLYTEDYDGTIYYYVYNNNTDASADDGTKDNLIEYVKSAADAEDPEGTYTYIEGDTLPTNVKDDNGDALAYNFVVDSIDGDVATITFTKN